MKKETSTGYFFSLKSIKLWRSILFTSSRFEKHVLLFGSIERDIRLNAVLCNLAQPSLAHLKFTSQVKQLTGFVTRSDPMQ